MPPEILSYKLVTSTLLLYLPMYLARALTPCCLQELPLCGVTSSNDTFIKHNKVIQNLKHNEGEKKYYSGELAIDKRLALESEPGIRFHFRRLLDLQYWLR